ncbi:MAG: hypothetical protein ACRENA_06330 [Vulcanimicrobiaceae bacterium]
MRFTVLIRLGAALGTVFLLTRCHGVGSSLPSNSVSTATSTMGNATFSVSPAAGVQSLVISLAQVNGAVPSTKSAAFTMNLTAGTRGCTAVGETLSCAATVPAPIGNDVFTITTYSGQNGTGSVVATTQASSTIAATGKQNCVQLTPGQGGSTHGASI